MRFLAPYRHRLDTAFDYIGKTSAWAIPLMAMATSLIVILRDGFDLSSSAWSESVLYLHAVSLLLGIPYTMKHDGHVRVDFLRLRWQPETRRRVEIAGHLLFMSPICALLFFSSLEYVSSSWEVRERSREFDGLEYVYLLKTMIPLTAILLMIQTLIRLLHAAGDPPNPGK